MDDSMHKLEAEQSFPKCDCGWFGSEDEKLKEELTCHVDDEA